MDLLAQIKKIVAEERRITTELLKLLALAERELLYAERGYSSMHEFCVKELGYSEGAAVRRVKAMRLMKGYKGVEEKLISGALSLSVATQLEGAFKKSALSAEAKMELISTVEGLSSREAEKKLVEILPDVAPPKREIRAISPTENLLKIVVDDFLLEKIDLLRAMYSHRMPGMSYRDLLELLVFDALKKKKHRDNYVDGAKRYIPPALKTKIWERDQGRCTYRDPKSGRKCQSNHLLQFDHIVPVAYGGCATEGNLRLLCWVHNKLAAKKANLTYEPQTNLDSSKRAARSANLSPSPRIAPRAPPALYGKL